LLLFLHGSGSSGGDLDEIAGTGLPKRARDVDLPFVIVAPQCPAGDDWTYPTQQRRLSQLVDSMSAQYKIDPQRMLLTGYSMGGFAVWDLAYAHPHRFAAIVPICGRGSPARAATIKHLPAWVFHGAQDRAITVKASRKMVEALRACGATVRYTEYPDGEHNVWDRAYADPALVEWLLAQRRPDDAAPAP
jgi:predicted peptidase